MENEQRLVFMYHGIVSGGASFPTEREVGAELYDVDVEDFRQQMQWLKTNGYDGIKDVVLTFDDGEMNNFQVAFPILRELGFSAYFFIIAKRIGKPGYMGWSQIKELSEAGMIIGSHGFSHEILTNLLDTQVEQELLASKNYLERNTGISIETLSIPRGFCNDAIIRKAYVLGYKQIFISERPRGLQSSCESRIAIKRGWSLNRFEQAVSGIEPRGDKIFNDFKRVVKYVLRESGYNFLRNILIKLGK